MSDDSIFATSADIVSRCTSAAQGQLQYSDDRTQPRYYVIYNMGDISQLITSTSNKGVCSLPHSADGSNGFTIDCWTQFSCFNILEYPVVSIGCDSMFSMCSCVSLLLALLCSDYTYY